MRTAISLSGRSAALSERPVLADSSQSCGLAYCHLPL